MSTWIGTFCSKAVWPKWINIVGHPLIGICLFKVGYIFLQDDTGYRSGMLYVISGSFWFLGGVLEWLSHYLNVVGEIVTKVIITILIISAAVLILIA